MASVAARDRMRPAETATQKLHRITSYTPGGEWDEPPNEPEAVQDLKTNDLSRFPWFTKRYEERIARVALPRNLPTTRAPRSPCSPLGGSGHEEWTCGAVRLLHLRPASCARWNARYDVAVPGGRLAGGRFRSSCTWRSGRDALPPACITTTRSITPSS